VAAGGDGLQQALVVLEICMAAVAAGVCPKTMAAQALRALLFLNGN
jgi:hypothetical protein